MYKCHTIFVVLFLLDLEHLIYISANEINPHTILSNSHSLEVFANSEEEQHRQKVIRELIDTEATYLLALKLVKKVKKSKFKIYYTSELYICEHNQADIVFYAKSSLVIIFIYFFQAFINPMRNSGIVSEKDIDLIFVNWDELILVSSYFNK